MNFYDAFREMVIISDTSIKDIADAMGYESSYMSK